MSEHHGQSGFTLIEALVALAIVAMVVTTCLMFRTGSLVDANEARNWRVAREVASEILSELRAGAREEPPDYMNQKGRQPIPKMRDVRDWSYQVVIGEDNISEIEGDLESEGESDTEGSQNSASDRREWQRERSDLRKARQQGKSYYEYREKSDLDEEDRLARDDLPPSEDEFEDVAVFVFFPNARIVQGHGGKFSHFVLKARLSTMALEGLTPEEAEIQAEGQGTSSEGGEGATKGGATK
jgi:prepilin-type N-terminal cleavage/methylation domain-containing protein